MNDLTKKKADCYRSIGFLEGVKWHEEKVKVLIKALRRIKNSEYDCYEIEEALEAYTKSMEE